MFEEKPGTLHVPVAALGIVGYGMMAGTALLGRMGLLLVLAEVGFFFAAMLTYLEAYVIQKWCIYCLWSQGIVATLLLATTAVVTSRWWAVRRARQAAAGGVYVA